MKHEEYGTINKKKYIGYGWHGLFTLYVDNDFRFGFRLSRNIFIIELFFFSVGLYKKSSGRISKSSDFIDKNKKIGKLWMSYFTLYLDGKLRLGFQIRKSQISMEIIFFSIGIWNLYSAKSFKLK